MFYRVLLLFSLGALALAQDYPDFPWEFETELDEYVHRDDGYFSWEVIDEIRFRYVTVYILNMTSQLYMSEDFSTRGIWWHYMGIAVPDEIEHTEHGILGIGSWGNTDDPPGPGTVWNVLASSVANDTKTITSYILQVPNQPIIFRDDPKQSSRREDNIIAYSWRWFYDEYVGNGNPDTPYDVVMRMPMTRAAKRGLDTIAEFAAANVPGTNIDKFMVLGASKRGWTTWSLAATDPRVIGISPLVFSLMKFEEVIQHHFRSMGGAWSFAFGPYWNENLTLHLTDPTVEEELFQLEDMWRFRSRLAGIPKLLISATGDEFFFCSDHHYWWDELEGDKWLMMVPNAEHTLFPHYVKIYRTVVGFYLSILRDEVDQLPSITYRKRFLGNGGVLEMDVEPEPESLRAMRAVTINEGERRDWRLIAGDGAQNVTWRETEYEIQGNGEYQVEFDEEDNEWVGVFFEGVWNGPDDFPMTFTTEVHIVPDSFPVEGCDGDACYGYLV